jgi:hypothetical protein
MIVGHQIKYAADVIAARLNRVDLGSTPEELDYRLKLASQIGRVAMQIGVSVAVMSLACWLLVARTDDEQIQKLASGLIGTVLGYWLR